MEKFLNTLSVKINTKIAKGFKCCFPVLRLFVGFCNVILALIGIIVLGAAVTMYIVPRFHLFLDALKHIFNVHTIFGSAIGLGALTICIGAAGIYFLCKGCYEKLGLQTATFLILLIAMAAIAFTFWTEWKQNSQFGISYATQSYNPNDKHGQYFKSIQEFLFCCGSNGPRDYDIANEHFEYATAPFSCCNYQKFPTECTESAMNNSGNKKQLAISVHMAFETGCMTKMEKVLWPIIVYIIFMQSGLSFLCMVASTILIIGYQSYIKTKFSHSNKVSLADDHSKNDYEEPLKLESRN